MEVGNGVTIVLEVFETPVFPHLLGSQNTGRQAIVFKVGDWKSPLETLTSPRRKSYIC